MITYFSELCPLRNHFFWMSGLSSPTNAYLFSLLFSLIFEDLFPNQIPFSIVMPVEL